MDCSASKALNGGYATSESVDTLMQFYALGRRDGRLENI
jgi:hypothetical protein